MKGLNFFKVGTIYRDRVGSYKVLEIIGNKKMKYMYLHNNEIKWTEHLDIKKRIHENIPIPNGNRPKLVWVVGHQEDLWDKDNRRIGFYSIDEWVKLNIGDIVTYYRYGKKQIMGVFEIIDRKDSDPAFNSPSIKKKLKYQCKLDLLSNDVICHDLRSEKGFSFHKSMNTGRPFGRRRHVIQATREDLKLILRDPSVVELND